MVSIINFILLKNVIVMALINSIIITNLVQKIKENLTIKNSNKCVLISLVLSFFIGTLLAYCFSSLDIIYCIWSSLFSFMGADSLYKILEGKLYKSLSDLNRKEN